MAKASQAVLPISPTPFDSGFDEHSPGLRSYYASLYALCSSAIRMGEVKMRYPMSQADDYRRAMVEYAESFGGEVMEQIDDAMFALAQQWQEFDSFEFLGSGAQMATAWFDAAKIYEATGDVATYEDMENWCHVNYFARDHRRVGTVLSISKDSPAMVRALEVAEVLARLRPTLIVTDADAALFPEEATVCQLPSPRYGFLAPLMDYVPVALLSGYLARLKGVSLFRGGEPAFQSPVSYTHLPGLVHREGVFRQVQSQCMGGLYWGRVHLCRGRSHPLAKGGDRLVACLLQVVRPLDLDSADDDSSGSLSDRQVPAPQPQQKRGEGAVEDSVWSAVPVSPTK